MGKFEFKQPEQPTTNAEMEAQAKEKLQAELNTLEANHAAIVNLVKEIKKLGGNEVIVINKLPDEKRTGVRNNIIFDSASFLPDDHPLVNTPLDVYSRYTFLSKLAISVHEAAQYYLEQLMRSNDVMLVDSKEFNSIKDELLALKADRKLPLDEHFNMTDEHRAYIESFILEKEIQKANKVEEQTNLKQ